MFENVIRLATSSPGRKVLAALSGLFLTFFLVIHLLGNLQLLLGDGGLQFNQYAETMSTSPLIMLVSFFTYGVILFHVFLTVFLAIGNRRAVGSIQGGKLAKTALFSKTMPYLGALLLFFLVVHLSHIWWPFRASTIPLVEGGPGDGLRDLQSHVEGIFSSPWMVLFYGVGMIALGLHIAHGLGSAARSLGRSHGGLSGGMTWGGRFLAVLLSLGFFSIPMWLFLKS